MDHTLRCLQSRWAGHGISTISARGATRTQPLVIRQALPCSLADTLLASTGAVAGGCVELRCHTQAESRHPITDHYRHAGGLYSVCNCALVAGNVVVSNPNLHKLFGLAKLEPSRLQARQLGESTCTVVSPDRQSIHARMNPLTRPDPCT